MAMTKLPWYRESAFRAWVAKASAAFGAAIVGLAGDIANAQANWTTVLLTAAIYAVGDFVLSVPAIFFTGPDTYVDVPPAV